MIELLHVKNQFIDHRSYCN